MNPLRSLYLPRILSLTTLGALSTSASATTIDWTGGTSVTWATGSNWTGGVPPASSLTTDIARFNQTSYGFQPTATSGRSIAGLIFGDGSTSTAAVTITTSTATNRLNVGASGIVMNAASGAVTVGTGGTQGIRLGASQTWQNDSSSLLTVSAVTNVGDVTPFTLTLTGSGSGGTAINGITDGGTVGTTSLVVNMSGSGAATLAGTNTFTGGIVLTAGTLNLNSASAMGGTGSSLTINGGTIDQTVTSTTLTGRPITLGANFAYGGTNNLNMGTGAVTNAGDRTITLNGTAKTLTLGGTMTNTKGSAQTTTVNGVGNTLALGGYALSDSAANYTNIINGTGNVSIGVVSNGGTSTASGLTYSGSGNLTLTGAGTFSGPLTINSGIVTAAGAGVAATSGPLGIGATTVNSGAELRATATSALLGSSSINLVGGTLRGYNAATANFGGAVSVTADSTVINERTGTASATSMTHTYGTLAIGANTLNVTSTNNQIGGNSGVTFGATTLMGNAVFNVTNNGDGTNLTVLTLGALSGSGSLTKTGSGNLNIGTAASGFTGDTLIRSGTLAATSATGLGTGTVYLGNATGNANAALSVDLGNATIANNVVVVANSGSAVYTITNPSATSNHAVTYSGTLTLNDDVTLVSTAGGGNMTFNNTVIGPSSGTATITNSGTGATTFGTGSSIGANINIVHNSGTFSLSGTNASFNGSIAANGGTMNVTATALSNGLSTVAINSGATFNNSQGNNTAVVVAGFTDGQSGGGSITSSASNRFFNLAGSGNYNFSGSITSTGLGLVKSGSGTQILGGNHLYTGTTTISGGTLIINGSLANTAVAVNSGGTLAGSGTIGGATTAAAGSSLAPGTDGTAGNLTFAVDTNLTLTGLTGGTQGLVFDLGSSSDKITLSGLGVLAIGSGTMNLADFDFTILSGFGAGVYTLFDTAAAINGTLDSNLANLTGLIGSSGYSGTLSLANSNNDIILTVAPIPEPSTYALLAGGLAVLAFLRRRKKV